MALPAATNLLPPQKCAVELIMPHRKSIRLFVSASAAQPPPPRRYPFCPFILHSSDVFPLFFFPFFSYIISFILTYTRNLVWPQTTENRPLEKFRYNNENVKFVEHLRESGAPTPGRPKQFITSLHFFFLPATFHFFFAGNLFVLYIFTTVISLLNFQLFR